MINSRTKWILGAAVAAVVAVVGFNVSLSTVVLIGFVLMCPLMMLGMHGHGRSHSSSFPQTDSHESIQEKENDGRMGVR